MQSVWTVRGGRLRPDVSDGTDTGAITRTPEPSGPVRGTSPIGTARPGALDTREDGSSVSTPLGVLL